VQPVAGQPQPVIKSVQPIGDKVAEEPVKLQGDKKQ
jgi:hypothetical protein